MRFRSAAGVATTLGKVPSAADCAAFAGGWFYDDPANPTTMLVRPQTCTEIQGAGPGASIDVLFGCRSVPSVPR